MDDDWVQLQWREEYAEMLNSWLEGKGDSVGLCLLCGSPIRSLADFIPGTNTHNCPEGIRLENSDLTPKRCSRDPLA